MVNKNISISGSDSNSILETTQQEVLYLKGIYFINNGNITFYGKKNGILIQDKPIPPQPTLMGYYGVWQKLLKQKYINKTV